MYTMDETKYAKLVKIVKDHYGHEYKCQLFVVILERQILLGIKIYE